MTTYGPEQVSQWTQADLDALTGRHITVRIRGDVWVSRVVESARHGVGYRMLVIEWQGEGSLTASLDGVEITVHDEGQGA